MRIISVTDIHNHITAITRLKDHLAWADVIIVSGDLTHFGYKPGAVKIIDAFRVVNKSILAVSGNCDHPDVENFLLEEGIGIHCRQLTTHGVAFVGLGGSLPAPVPTPNEKSERDIQHLLEDIAKRRSSKTPFILVSHQPPYDTQADRLSNGRHVGSRSVRSFIMRYEPLICFTGHIHEGRGIDELGKTIIVNPGPLNQGFIARVDLSAQPLDVEIRDLSKL